MNRISKVLVVIAIALLLTTDVFASSVYIEEVEGEDTSITINKGEVSDEITKIDRVNNEVEIELNIKAEKLKEIKDNTEIIFLIDDSGSMNTRVNSGIMTRKTNVINSTKKLIENIHENNEDIKMGIVYFSNTAYNLAGMTNDKEILISKLTSLGLKMPSGGTAMATGLKMAKSKFSADANNKIIILLTDGMPTEDYMTVRNSLQDDNVYIISTLVGLESATKNEKTIISVLFGTEDEPVPDKLYNITDNEVEETISKDIYDKVIDDFKETIKDITIESEIPNEIIENFDIELEDESNGYIEDNKILWNIPELQSLENESLKYTLTLKEDFNENIIDKVIDISENVQIEYKDIENVEKIEVMENVPQIMVKQEQIEEIEEVEEIQEPEEEVQEEVEEQIEEEIEEIEQVEEIIEEQEEVQIEEPEQEENTKIELKESKQEEKAEKIEEEKIETKTEEVEEQKEQEVPKVVEEVVEQKTIQIDNTTANKELAYTGTNKTLIITIGITLVFAAYEGIKLIKAYKII